MHARHAGELALFAVLFWSVFTHAASAAPPVTLELFAGRSAMFSHVREWLEDLDEAGFSSIRVRAEGSSDEIAVENRGSADAPIYHVIGHVAADGRLRLPGGVFARSDARRIKQWIKQLRDDGPDSLGRSRDAFGMTSSQLKEVMADLGRRLNLKTKGAPADQLTKRVAAELKLPLVVDRRAQRELARAEAVVRDELTGLTMGTALAAIVRPAGLVLTPRREGGKTFYVLERSAPGARGWPIGWPTDKSPRESAPSLSKSINVEIDDVALGDALQAIGHRLDVPMVIDYNALAVHDIDLGQSVNLPKRRTSYRVILRDLLGQADLKMEYRLDEKDRTFLWITSRRPLAK